MSIRILKSIFVFVFLSSSAFFVSSDVVAWGPSDIAKVTPEGRALGQGADDILGVSRVDRGPADNLVQFTSGGHVLGFRKGEMFVASGDHALKVEFVNARPVSPGDEEKSRGPESSRPAAQPLGKVSYPNLWDGVTLVYENHGSGVVKSTYRIEPVGNSVSSPLIQIRLRYNVPVKVDDSGELVFSFSTGEMRESRPVAWQEIKGKRVPVDVTYRLIGDQEVGFKAGSYDPRYPLVIDPVLSWNTFLGSSSTDYGWAIAVDTSGNVYVAGHSNATWGSPVRPFASGWDAFAAKLNGSGALQWNTFLGSSSTDYGYDIAVDTSGNIYVTGRSEATWGSPVRPFSGGNCNAFAAKLNGSGALQWNTFLGGSDYDLGWAIAVDTSGNVYVAGDSGATWGSPVRPYSGGNYDAFAAKLNGSGALQWNTFLGGSGYDRGWAIAVDTSGNIYVTGSSPATWGSPVRPHAGGTDAFVAKLNGSGVLQWNTFLGGSGYDEGYGIAVDTSGNIYVTGSSPATWGSPVRPFAGYNAFVAKLNGSGALQWNTFLGSSSGASGWAIAVDTSGNIFVGGTSNADWGSPDPPFASGNDAFAAKLDNNGALLGNNFLGGSSDDFGRGIAVDTSGNVYVTGESYGTWGSPVRPFAGNTDAFVAKIYYSESWQLPIVTTTMANSVTETSAVSGGNVTSDGGATVTERGVCVSTSANPTTANAHTHDGSGTGAFTSNLTGCTPATTYHVRAYATNSMGTAYGSDLTFTTLSLGAVLPTVTTTAISSLTKTSFMTGGNVTSGGSAAVTDRGVCVSTAANPTIADAHTHDGAGTGVFVSNLTDGTPGETYHVRAYATSAVGTAYGSDIWFRTLGGSKSDFNADGQSDILWRNMTTGENAVWFMGYTATGVEGLQMTSLQNMFPGAVRETGELFKGKPGIVYFDPRQGMENANPTTLPAIWIEPMGTRGLEIKPATSVSPFYGGITILGLTRTSVASLPSLMDFNWVLAGIGDFNGDGWPDFVLRNMVTGENGIWYIVNGAKVGADYMPSVLDLSWKIVGTGDFNGDKKFDLLWRNSITGENVYWYMDRATRIGSEQPPTVSDTNWQIVGIGDFNADGKPDFLWHNVVTGENYIWFMDGGTRLGGDTPPMVTDLNWQIVGVGDFNGDGKMDILWRNSMSGENGVWYMNGASRIGTEYVPTIADLAWKIVNR